MASGGQIVNQRPAHGARRSPRSSDGGAGAGGRRGPDLKTLIKESQSAKRR